MNIIKRAWLYVIRQKLKTLILFLLLVIIATFVLTGLAVESSAGEAARNVRISVGGTIKLVRDTSNKNMDMIGEGQYGQQYQYAGDSITEETLEAIQQVQGVTGYNSVNNGNLFGAAVNFKYLPGSFEMGTTQYGSSAPHSTVLFSEKYSGFTSGNIILVKGRHILPTDSRVIMISKELADCNDLTVGDIMEMYIEHTDQIIELEIVGIFSGTEGSSEGALLSSMIASNQGICDMRSTEYAYGSQYAGLGDLEIFVEDPRDIQNVYDEIAKLPEIKGKTFTMSMNRDEYETIENPLLSLQSLVRTLLFIITVVSISILALLLTLWTRSRIRETGILMSLGLSKVRIIGQHIVEVVIIAIFAFSLSYFVSNAVSNQAGAYLMEQATDAQALAPQEKEIELEDFSSYFGQLAGNASASNNPQKIVVTVTPQSIILVYTVGILIIFLAVLVASYGVLRLKPREILSKLE